MKSNVPEGDAAKLRRAMSKKAATCVIENNVWVLVLSRRVMSISACITSLKPLRRLKDGRDNREMFITLKDEKDSVKCESDSTFRRKRSTSESKVCPGIAVTTSKRGRVLSGKLDADPIAAHLLILSATPSKLPQSDANMHNTWMNKDSTRA